ncbi:MAG: molecular chaperone HtpG, partial [Bacteroidales bacterium]|nr:molecular chaperone HtpG [Bacteroidales bacterium]
PVIKKFLYSDHEIFLRELVANGIDAAQKMKAISGAGDFKGEIGNLRVEVSLNPEAGTLTISDNGIGMTAEEIDQYINQIAFSSAEKFLEKYKNQLNGIIGHFGLGFYSAFMVSKKVEVRSLSWKEGSEAICWSCDGNPEYTMEPCDKTTRGTEITLFIEDESKEFLEEKRIESLLLKYCRFLPVEIVFGKEKEWKDGKEVETGKDRIINDTNPLWTRKPADLKEEDYQKFYGELYPMLEEPLFNIHLNVDYPFNLTGILYFPKIKDNLDIARNKIQLYCNQVFVTDSVENIVPDFLTLLHGVIDSPDIPLNVSRSYLQSDANVKKISSHITKKVADRLEEIFKNDRENYEKKWDNLKLFIEYGMLTEEKFNERAMKFALLKNIDNKYFTYEEYKNLIEAAQTDKNKGLVYLYATDKDQQYTFIEAAQNKGYDVLLFDSKLDSHFINHLESKLEKSRFVRVDSDVIDKLIVKEDLPKVSLSIGDQMDLRPAVKAVLPEKDNYLVSFEALTEKDAPMIITQSEYMRRMREMSAMSGGLNFYGSMPDSYNLVVNANHPLVKQVLEEKDSLLKETLEENKKQEEPLKQALETLQSELKNKKEEEISQEQKDQRNQLEEQIENLHQEREAKLESFGKSNSLLKQMADLALLANNMLTGQALNDFIKRSVSLLK